MDRDTLSGSGIRLYFFLIYVSNLVYHNNSSVNGYKKQFIFKSWKIVLVIDHV